MSLSSGTEVERAAAVLMFIDGTADLICCFFLLIPEMAVGMYRIIAHRLLSVAAVQKVWRHLFVCVVTHTPNMCCNLELPRNVHVYSTCAAICVPLCTHHSTTNIASQRATHSFVNSDRQRRLSLCCGHQLARPQPSIRACCE